LNLFSGTIPSSYRELDQLLYLDVSGNGRTLNGTLRDELVEGWIGSSMVYLSVNDNALSGTISPRLGSLVQLSTLSLNSNRFTGPIPTGTYHQHGARSQNATFIDLFLSICVHPPT